MATVTPTVQYIPNGQANAVLVTWSNMANGDVGAPVEGVDYADRTVQFGGTFGVGGSVTFEGSNNNSAYVALTDPQGNAITKTAAALEVIEEGPRYARPNVTAGDGSTAITVTLWGRRSR